MKGEARDRGASRLQERLLSYTQIPRAPRQQGARKFASRPETVRLQYISSPKTALSYRIANSTPTGRAGSFCADGTHSLLARHGTACAPLAVPRCLTTLRWRMTPRTTSTTSTSSSARRHQPHTLASPGAVPGAGTAHLRASPSLTAPHLPPRLTCHRAPATAPYLPPPSLLAPPHLAPRLTLHWH